MSIEFSPIISSRQNNSSSAFSVQAIDLTTLREWGLPVLVVDQFRVTGRPFPPHPHAGFSAVTYVFEDSDGGLRSRDSLGNDLITGPGGIVWTEAGRGILHEEVPAVIGRELHAVQIFVNLSAKSKLVPPRLLRLESADIPEWHSIAGDRVRIAVGSFSGIRSPLTPSEPFSLLDAWVREEISFHLPEAHVAVIYVLSGSIRVRTEDRRQMQAESGQAFALRGSGRVFVEALRSAQLLVLQGAEIHESAVEYGGFIMKDRSQMMATLERYHAGRMGRLDPISKAEPDYR